jgi:hypothetical protein
LTKDAARRKNEEFNGGLGDRLVTVDLDPVFGLWWASTFSAEHVTVWGQPEAIESCIRDAEPV